MIAVLWLHKSMFAFILTLYVVIVNLSSLYIVLIEYVDHNIKSLKRKEHAHSHIPLNVYRILLPNFADKD